MQGLHLTADLYDCRCDDAWLLDARRLGEHCAARVREVGLRPVGELLHRFDASAHGPGGVTAALLLAESHLCVHTWPERRGVTLDVYVCNFESDHSAKAERLLEALITLFQPAQAQRQALRRGEPGLRPGGPA